MESGALGNYSSAGCSVTAESTATLMYWSCNFGAFRGLGGLPAGRVELRGEQNVSGLESPSSLAYNHPLNSRLDVPEGGIVPGARFNLVQGDRVIAMRCYTDGSVLPIGVDTSGGGRAALATAEGQSCLRWVVEDGSQYLFSAETGTLLSYTTTDRQVISNASSYLDVKHAEDGSLRQIWNLWDGLLNVESVTSTGYTIALYTPGQITGTDEQGFYTVTGAPFKTFVLSLSADGQFAVTEQTPARQPYAVTWWKNGLAWNMRRGTGEDAITTIRTRTELEPENSVWQLVTEISKNGIVAARTCAIYQTTDVGDLLLTLAEGYGSPEEQTTQYAYDQCGRLRTETAPDGSQTHDAYDLYGRLLSRDEPWAESGRRITRYTYACSGEADFSNEPATETADLLPLEGHVKTLTSTTWKYTTANHIKRTERRVTGLGVAGTRLTAEEQWLAGAANIHARGRTRFSRDLDGVQTWHDYAATTEHGALYTETVETRINGEAVPGQSTRAVTWITAEGQRVREENYLLLSTGQWALTGSAVYEFDTQNRWVKRTAGNGRLTERELMCDGGLLWEIDENGIRTDYAYDTARQLVEVTRSAVMDGETVITPETITTYAGCGRAQCSPRVKTRGEDYPRKHGVRLAGENDFLYGRPGPGHYLRLQPGRPDGHANRPFRGYIHHAQRAGRNGDGRIRHGAAARHLRHRPGQRRCADLHESRLRGNANRAAAQYCQRSRGNPAHGRPQHRRRSHLHEEHLQRQGAAHQNADGRGQCGHDDGPDPVGIRRLRQQNERNLETRRSGYGVQLAHHHVELRRGTGPG